MTLFRSFLAGALALAAFTSAFAQGADAGCIVAGRLSEGQWAPRMQGVQLLGADGRAVSSANKSALANVKQVKLSSPALLSRCDGDAALAQGPDAVGTKKPVPALAAGAVDVQVVSYPKLRRGGELVELRVSAPAERVSMITR